jgi:hypothetical protein
MRGVRVCAVIGLAAAVVVAGVSAAAAEPVKVARTAAFADGSGASDKVQAECQLETKVPAFLDEFSNDIELVDGAPGSSGRVLELRITSVHAPGGGAFSGGKSLTVSGTLRQDGTEIGDFVATRFSGGGAWGGYKGTCAIIGRCAKTIGKDIAGWLSSPAKGSRLGDAR